MASWDIAQILRRCNINFVEEEMTVNDKLLLVCRAFLFGTEASLVFHSLNTPNEAVMWRRLHEFGFV